MEFIIELSKLDEDPTEAQRRFRSSTPIPGSDSDSGLDNDFRDSTSTMESDLSEPDIDWDSSTVAESTIEKSHIMEATEVIMRKTNFVKSRRK